MPLNRKDVMCNVKQLFEKHNDRDYIIESLGQPNNICDISDEHKNVSISVTDDTGKCIYYNDNCDVIIINNLGETPKTIIDKFTFEVNGEYVSNIQDESQSQSLQFDVWINPHKKFDIGDINSMICSKDNESCELCMCHFCKSIFCECEINPRCMISHNTGRCDCDPCPYCDLSIDSEFIDGSEYNLCIDSLHCLMHNNDIRYCKDCDCITIDSKNKHKDHALGNSEDLLINMDKLECVKKFCKDANVKSINNVICY